MRWHSLLQWVLGFCAGVTCLLAASLYATGNAMWPWWVLGSVWQLASVVWNEVRHPTKAVPLVEDERPS